MEFILNKYKCIEKRDYITEKIFKEYIEKYPENELINHISLDEKIEIKSALIPERKNIISWYDFKENSKILEIGAGIGELTEFLTKKFFKVVSIEKNKFNAEIISKRLKDKNNLTIIASANIKDIEFDEKFDYILIKDDIENLKFVKNFLNDNGTIILLLNNKYGISKLSSINNINEIDNDLLNKFEIEKFIEKQGYKNYRFYYPLPNYNYANMIFSDMYLPKYTDTKIMNNSLRNPRCIRNFDELNALKEFTKENQFELFTNSYFIEINPKSKVKFIGYNNLRKEKFQLCTKIYDDIVIKEPIEESSIEHINSIKSNIDELKEMGFCLLDSEINGKINSRYVSEKSSYQIVIDRILNNDLEGAYKFVDDWYKDIKEKFKNELTTEINEKIPVKYTNDMKKLTLVKKLYLDLILENSFYIDNKFYYFDQEWYLENVPVEFLLFRLISNLFTYNPEISEVVKYCEFYEKFDIMKNLDLYKKIEQIFQQEILDYKIISLYDTERKIKENQNSDDNIKKMKEIINVKQRKITIGTRFQKKV